MKNREAAAATRRGRQGRGTDTGSRREGGSGARASNARHSSSRKVENVLVLQGGGSLGAFACGVFRALASRGVKVDIVSGTSIGAINAAIIAGSKSGRPEDDLEEFWMEIGESSYSIIPDLFFFDFEKDGRVATKVLPAAGINAAMFGVPKMFLPRWLRSPRDPVHDGVAQGGGSSGGDNKDSIFPHDWTYLYDHSPLAKTLEKYIDFEKLDGSSSSSSSSGRHMGRGGGSIRLIITSVNVLTSEPIVFDSAKMRIEPKHLLASTGYPAYGFPWVQVEDGVYAWDGSLLDNTPVRQVIQASPRNDKHIYIVENYPRKIDALPSNMMEVADRTRDIIFSDKTKAGIRLARFITRQIRLIEELYDVFETADHGRFDPGKISNIREEYRKIVDSHGAEILSVNHIVRKVTGVPHLLKNANFTVREIRSLIRQGEEEAASCLAALGQAAGSDSSSQRGGAGAGLRDPRPPAQA